jgi:thiol-disulfide isomerase/thioredoxin
MKTKIVKKLALFVIVVLSCGGCRQEGSIEVDIKGLGNDTLFISISTLDVESDLLEDTICAVNDKFSYVPRYHADSPLFVWMIPRKGIYQRLASKEYSAYSNEIFLLWLPNQKVKVKGEFAGNAVDYEAESDEFNRNHSLIRRKLLKNWEHVDQIEMKIDTMLYVRADKDLIDSLFEERLKEITVIRETRLAYLLNNPDAELSGYYLSTQSMDTVAKYHHCLPERVRNGFFKRMIDDKLKSYHENMEILKNKSLIQPGNVAPNFTLPSIDGNSLSLYSINAKFTILDFWGSWCGWCIKGFPKMKEYYEKYKSKVEFIGIACNDKEPKWKEAVEQHQLQWKHVINNDSDIDNVSARYAIEAYPTKIILDKDKKIIAVFQGENDKFYAKLDELNAQ